MSRSEGVWGEALVADYLREKGYKLAAATAAASARST